jgi:Protein of unknown function (DUF551)
MTIDITPEAVERLEQNLWRFWVDKATTLSAALTASQAETAAAWQPIETAPNIRGVRIIGWCVFPAGAEAREVKGYIPLDRMEDAVQWFYGSVLQNVTHWMPLPPPPKGTTT